MAIKLLTLAAGLLLTPALVHAMPAVEPEGNTPTQTLKLIERANAPSMQTNTFTTSAAAAYTNCCQFKPGSDGTLLYTLNLAGVRMFLFLLNNILISSIIYCYIYL